MTENIPQVEGTFDMYKDWEGDTGYFLIKIYHKEQKIGIRYCDMQTHKPRIDIFGRVPQEIYVEAIKRGLIHNMQHAAYLGKELMKAFVCLKLGKEYEQDQDEQEMTF